jgi:transcriptional regulator with XRE-family HTH domain
MLQFELATTDEIGTELGQRLRSQRLAQDLKQADLAARAGVSEGTVRNLENKGQASLESLLRIVAALGLSGSLSELFVLRPTSIKEMESASAGRMRASGAGR